tara:strand:+ start:525 stop:734 length:210 start_codon:yes stop_codon:yes gene_type:complete
VEASSALRNEVEEYPIKTRSQIMLANETLYSLKEYPHESSITDVSDTFVDQNQEKKEAELPISDSLLAV